MHQTIPHKTSVNALFFTIVAFAIIFVYSNDKILVYEIKTDKLLAMANGFNPDDVKDLKWKNIDVGTHWAKRDSHEIYECNNELYLFGGLDADGTFVNGLPDYTKAKYYNDIWKTADGINWTQVSEHSNLPLLRSMSIVPFKDKIYLLNGWGPEVGLNKYIWTTSDCVNWEKSSVKPNFPTREGDRTLAAKGKLYMFGGVSYEQHKTFNDVWISDDGLNWKELVKNAPWHSRWDHDVAYFNNKFILYGGMDIGDIGFSDLWTSKDAINWELITANSEMGARQGQVLASYKNVSFLVGGLDAKTNLGESDTWFTFNGRDWQKLKNNGLWAPREDHRVAVFNDMLLLYGGMNDKWEWQGDSWAIPLNFF
ncbi:MAG: hypothetical protein AAB513_00005 [Patescibacteria group bacterium]